MSAHPFSVSAPGPSIPAGCAAILSTSAGTSSELIVICRKLDCRIVYANATAERWLNQSGDTPLTAHSMEEFISVGARNLFQNEIILQANVLGRWSGGCVLRDTWGSEFPAQARFTIHHPKAPDEETLLCLQAERTPEAAGSQHSAFNSDHELLHALMETVPDNIYFKDRHSRFIRVSRTMARHVGRADPNEFIGLTDFDLFTTDHARAAYEDEQRIMRTGIPVLNLEEKETRADGQVTWVSTTKLPLFDVNGAIVGTYGLSRDITAQKLAAEETRQLELKLHLAQKLESIGRLAAGIAHEINTPTQFITDNVHFLRDNFPALAAYLHACQALRQAAAGQPALDAHCAALDAALPPEELAYQLAEIPKTLAQSLEGLGRISRIVHSLKEFSHPQNSHRTPVDLNHVIETAVTVSRHEWKYVAEVVTDFSATLPPVPCLVDEFNQVLLNLIINAAHAIEAAAAIRGKAASPGVITLRTRLDGSFALVEIEDNGTGIPPEIRSRIFDPFFTTKEIGKGSGQGLAIVRSVIVQHHHGTVDFTSEVGRGTIFQLRLPLTTNPPPS